MGLFDFLKNKGKKVSTDQAEPTAQQIQNEVQRAMGSALTGLGVYYTGGKVTLQGEAKDQAAKEKAILVAGNIQGVDRVDGDQITLDSDDDVATAQTTTYYTIQKGDTLSKIAKSHYGDANKYHQIFDANREVIEDPDKIYEGQQIRIPADA
jgi:nucleoid-associated protein YgaU